MSPAPTAVALIGQLLLLMVAGVVIRHAFAVRLLRVLYIRELEGFSSYDLRDGLLRPVLILQHRNEDEAVDLCEF